MNPKQQMLRSSGVVAFFNALGGISGILVETSIAAYLGLSWRSDTFYVAYTIPYIITNLITATGQFSLVPFFSSLESSQDEADVWRGFSYVVNILFLGLGAIVIGGVVASPWIIDGIAPGFTREQIIQATYLSRWLFLIIVPAGIGEALRSFLLSRHYFAISSAAGFIRNLVSIVMIIVGFRYFGVQSIFLGYLGGYLLQLVILSVPIVAHFRPRYFLTLRGSGEAFRNLRGAGTAQVGVALAWQGVVVIERIIASFLAPGTLTALNYGFRILGSLAELFGGSVGTAALPGLSRAVARKDHDEERRLLRDTFGISLVLLTPMAVFCLLLSHDIIRLVFQRGSFTPEATRLMAMVLFYYSWSLLPFAFVRILTFYMFARNASGAFVRLAFFMYSINVGFDLLYVGIFRLGAKGIPLGLLSSVVITGVLVYRRNLCDVRDALDRVLGIFSSKVLAAACLTALAIWGLKWITPRPVSTRQDFLYLTFLCGVGSLVFLASLIAMRTLTPAWLTLIRRGPEPAEGSASSIFSEP